MKTGQFLLIMMMLDVIASHTSSDDDTKKLWLALALFQGVFGVFSLIFSKPPPPSN